MLVAALVDGRVGSFFSPASWSRWDSGLYLQIARHGYVLRHCTGPNYPPHSWCGTAGWAPLYPGMMAALGHLGLSIPASGVLLSLLFAFLTLQVVWLLIGPSWRFAPLCCLAFAACFPGTVYLYAIFPVSLLTFLSALCLLLFIRRRYLAAGLVGASCAWAFATGPLIVVVLLMGAVLVDRGPDLWRIAAKTAGIAAGGFAALLLMYQLWVGDWSAYFKTSAKYGNGLHDPIADFVTAFTGGLPAKFPLQSPNPGYDYLVPKAQTAFVAALVLGLVVWTLTRRSTGRTGWLLLTYTVVVWLVPLMAGASLSRYRMEALLVPCVALCPRLPRVLLVALTGSAAVLAVGLAVLFTRGQII